MLISRHRDGEINAIAAERLGVGTIRGSGDHGGGFHPQGRRQRLPEMLDALEEGYSVALTADVPKVSRVAGLGIVKLAQHVRPADLSGGDRDQPPHRARQLGPHRDQPAVQPRRRRGRRADPRAAPMPTTRRLEARAPRRSRTRLNAATERAYAIVDGIGRRAATVAERLPLDAARAIAVLTAGGDAARAAAAAAAIALKRGKEDPERLRGAARRKRDSRARTARWSGCTAPASANCWRSSR